MCESMPVLRSMGTEKVNSVGNPHDKIGYASTALNEYSRK